MQGIVFMPDNLHTGASPPNRTIDIKNTMDISLHPNLFGKDFSANRSNQSDSGIHSATGTSSLSDEMMDQTQNSDADNRSESSSPERKYFCPICETVFVSQHEFTLHIRSHNNESEPQDSDKSYTCRICYKVLSSSSSLDRHTLIHSGERPFTCKYCGDTFTTNGNMHRHMRTHSQRNDSCESDASISSNDSKGIEFNNNKINHKVEDIKKETVDEECNDNKRIFPEEKYSIPKKIAKDEPQDLSHRTQVQNYQCPVCERNDFTSVNALEMHLEDNHRDCLTKCRICNQSFKNNKLLNFHYRITHHLEENDKLTHSVVGFKDLTFVDFSSEKFPYIAKYECEKNLHKVSGGLKFICESCNRAFPCSNSLNIHKKDCIVGLDLSTNGNKLLDLGSTIKEEKDVKRTEFFASLDLQTNSPNTPNNDVQPAVADVKEKLQKHLLQTIDGTKDLADIQSIISMTTCGSLLQHLQAKSTDIPLLPPTSSLERRSQELPKQENEEESQDAFAAEFRKMKLRGEFPCRLCTAVFPNLRALKGHNRAHLNSNNNGTYRCNMCPHSSLDKAALIRHMRTHNGDRPYECSLCNYAFTTKANCERHLRNRHAKSTREEVKKAIIYHPSEDPSNDEITKMLSRDETKKINSGLILSNEVTEPINDKIGSPSPKVSNSRDLHNFAADKFNFNNYIPSSPNLPITTNLLSLKNSLHLTIPKEESVTINSGEVFGTPTDVKQNKEHLSPYMKHSFKFSPKIENMSTPHATPKLQVRDLETLKQAPLPENNTPVRNEIDTDCADEESMNYVLDLSKKRDSKDEEKCDSPEELPQDLTKKSTIDQNKQNMSEILTQQLLKNTPKIDPLYASQLAFYRNSFHNLSNFPYWPLTCNPLLFPSVQAPMFPQDPQDIKERLQRLQFCSGGIIMNNLKHLHQQTVLPNVSSHSPTQNEQKCDLSKTIEPNLTVPNISECGDKSSLNLSTDNHYPETINNIQTPISSHPKPDITHSPNSVKMVIKNGILMPKQKQRRYRTERPFSCEHCSARFTLRSNMERHIKQQHPQFWSQRQRSNLNTLGRKNQTVASNHKSTTCNINIPNYHISKAPDISENKSHKISEKLKYAILAQHLKATQEYNRCPPETKVKEDDDDCALVIDENEDNKNNINDQVKSPDVTDQTKFEHTKEDFKYSSVQNSPHSHTSNFKNEDVQDLVPVSRLLDNASQQPFKEYFNRENEEHEDGNSEEEEEGLVASSSTSEGNNSGTDENRSESENTANNNQPAKKKSAYSLAPNRVSCPYCQRKFPWTSSLRRHILTHTGQKPFKCSHCPLLFTTKSNCDRHLLRKHGNSATTITNNVDSNQTPNYLMRNVPERPFKCSNCPSSTFSTYSNLKKHMNCKHSTPSSQSDDARSQVSTGYEAGSSEDEKLPCSGVKTDWDKQLSQTKIAVSNGTTEIHSAHVQNSELPFKCHLCDSSFSERQDTLDHIKDKHLSEYELLMSKNALESHLTPEENVQQYDMEDTDARGKFPDYANRKVICAFCMRRFWSAEDLRRHMRTHTGERPFSCDICQRRFTLKHSMLRHRKKHNVAFENDNINSDEDVNSSSNFVGLNDKITKPNRSGKTPEKAEESDGTEGSDLISNLLGIRDRSIIDQVLTASADDAAKLLGVKSGAAE